MINGLSHAAEGMKEGKDSEMRRQLLKEVSLRLPYYLITSAVTTQNHFEFI